RFRRGRRPCPKHVQAGRQQLSRPGQPDHPARDRRRRDHVRNRAVLLRDDDREPADHPHGLRTTVPRTHAAEPGGAGRHGRADGGMGRPAEVGKPESGMTATWMFWMLWMFWMSWMLRMFLDAFGCLGTNCRTFPTNAGKRPFLGAPA